MPPQRRKRRGPCNGRLHIAEQMRTAQFVSTRTLIAETCARARAFNHASGPVIDDSKQMLIGVCDQIKQSFNMHVANMNEPPTDLNSLLDPVRDAIASVRSEFKEAAALDIPLVEPQPRVLGSRIVSHLMPDGRDRTEVVEDVMYDMPVERTLQTWLDGNPAVLADVLGSPLRWRNRAAADAEAPLSEFVLSDASDGQAFKRHIAFLPEHGGKDGALPLMAVLYGDGVKIANPIGVFRNNSQVDFFYWALLNVDANQRTVLCNIQLACVCMNSHLKRYGPALVLSGAAPAGSGKVSTSFGAAVDRMSRGHTVQIPNPAPREVQQNADGTSTFPPAFVRLFVTMWVCLLLADCPAAAEMLCFKRSVGPSTVCCCRLCLARQVDPTDPRAMPLRRPNSFLPWDAEGTCSDLDMTANLDMARKGHYQLWDLRTSEQLETQRLAAEQLPPSERHAFMQNIGVNGFDLGLRAAGFDVSSARIDQMHCEWEGNCPKHLLGLLMTMMHVWKSVTLEQLNRALLDHSWPPGCAPQPFSSGSFIANGDLAKGDMTMNNMTAHDMMVFMVHSVAILGQFVPDDKWSGPHWQCWCLHADYSLLLLLPSYTLDAVRLLDVTIFRMQELFISIDTYYDLWTPNFHYATHLPLDILLWGPGHALSCLRFEALNQIYIAAGRHTNFKSLLGSTVQKVAIRRAFDLKAGVEDGRFLLKKTVRFVESLTYGTSVTLDLLWDSDLLANPTSDTITVTWLVAVMCSYYKYSVGTYIQDGTGIARITDLFSIESKCYVSLRHFTRPDRTPALLKDPETSQLFAFDDDLQLDGPHTCLTIALFRASHLKALHGSPGPRVPGEKALTRFWQLHL